MGQLRRTRVSRTHSITPRVATALAVILSADYSSSAVDSSFLLRLTSNYEYRGYTLSDNHAAAQANFDVAWSSGLFLGTWISTADFGGAELAANPYLGKYFALSPDWPVVTSIAGYFFDAKVDDVRANYGEGSVRLAYRDVGSVQANFAPDYYGTGAGVWSYEAELRYPASDTVEVSAGVGYQAGRKALNYDGIYYNAGITWFLLPFLTLDLRYHDLHEMNEGNDDYTAAEPLSGYHLDSPVIFSVSLGL